LKSRKETKALQRKKRKNKTQNWSKRTYKWLISPHMNKRKSFLTTLE